MPTYIIRGEVAQPHAAAAGIPRDADIVKSLEDLDAKRFPMARLVRLWNNLSNAKAIKRFKSQREGARRLWDALDRLYQAAPRNDTKQAKVIALLKRPEGARLHEITALTGWQPHTARGVLAGTLKKRLGFKIVATPGPDGRVYRITEQQ